MHIVCNFIPGHDKTSPVRTEHRTRRVFHISFAVIAFFCYDLLTVVAHVITRKLQQQLSPAFREGMDFFHVILHGGSRCTSGNARQFLVFYHILRRAKNRGPLL